MQKKPTTAKHSAQPPKSAPLEQWQVKEQPAPPAPTETNPDRDVLWQGLCKLAFNNRRCPDEWPALQAELQVIDQCLASTALELVTGVLAAGLPRWDWLPAPSDDELAQPQAWVARRLAEQHTKQDRAEHDRRLRQKIARAFPGQSPATGTGTINPVHLQKSKLSLEERLRRLQWTKDKHVAEGREFRRELLDHRSPHYISARNGGISNKQIIITANDIVEQRGGQRDPRPFDDNWNIVMGLLSE